jgi:hypothetical protein
MMPSCTGLTGRTPSPCVSAVATGVGDDRFATLLMPPAALNTAFAAAAGRPPRRYRAAEVDPKPSIDRGHPNGCICPIPLKK